MSESEKHRALVGTTVLLPWPGQAHTKIPFKVIDVAQKWGHWQLLVIPEAVKAPGGGFWTRTWFAPP